MVLPRKRVIVTGAGGFIGHHLVSRLKAEGHWVRGVDIKLPLWAASDADEFELRDLRTWEECQAACIGRIDAVYQLAADMGGIGYISNSHAAVARNNVLINVHMLEAARQATIPFFLFASSACVYAQSHQREAATAGLKEEDAHPADPEPGYGWEKLYSEQLCRYYRQDCRLDTCIVRLHNVYGPMGTFDGGREKAPAALCRKIALAADGDEIEIWGDGQQSRSFLYVDDCIDGLLRLTAYHDPLPVNLGSTEPITINGLVDLVAGIAGKTIRTRHNLAMPQGVRGRNSDNTRLQQLVRWQPSTPLREGLTETYRWIEQEIRRAAPLSRHGDRAFPFA